MKNAVGTNVAEVVAQTMTALAAGSNVIIRATQQGIGLRHDLKEALTTARRNHVFYNLAGWDPTEVTGIPYPTEDGVRYSTPLFCLAFQEDQTIVMDDANMPHPTVVEFIKRQAHRGGLVLIFNNDICTDQYDDFPAVRLAAGFA